MISKFFNFIINLQYAGWNLRNIVQNVKIAGMEGRQKKREEKNRTKEEKEEGREEEKIEGREQEYRKWKKGRKEGNKEWIKE